MGNIIIAAACNRDHFGDLKSIESFLAERLPSETKIQEYLIDPLSTDWNSELAPNHFRSGCAPISALEKADEDLNMGEINVAVIRGQDFLRSGYSKEDRHQLMDIYDGKISIIDGYTELAEQYIRLQGIDRDQFTDLRNLLFDNYLKTAKKVGIHKVPGREWYKNVSPLFRGVDCANPLIDFEGCLVLCSESFAQYLKLPIDNAVQICGIATESIEDGPDNIKKIALYEHLEEAYHKARERAGIDFVSQFINGNGLMEVYTCYPVVPLAFLMTLNFIKDSSELGNFLKRFEITITGGMNLARGPWNNPSLFGLIRMTKKLLQEDQQYGLIHGNGGLGYRQGIAILKKIDKRSLILT